MQEREFMRLGGMETIKVDVRIVAATNRDVFAMLLRFTVGGDGRQALVPFAPRDFYPDALPTLRAAKESGLVVVRRAFQDEPVIL
jgi:hypothetical protein